MSGHWKNNTIVTWLVTQVNHYSFIFIYYLNRGTIYTTRTDTWNRFLSNLISLDQWDLEVCESEDADFNSIILNNASPLVNNIIWPLSYHYTNKKDWLCIYIVQVHRKNVLHTCLNICLGTHVFNMWISSLKMYSYIQKYIKYYTFKLNCNSSIDNDCNVLQTGVENHALQKIYSPFSSFWQLTTVLFF